MEVKCAVCGQAIELAKWQQDYERLKERPGEHEPYVCEPCQDRVRRDAQHAVSFPR